MTLLRCFAICLALVWPVPAMAAPANVKVVLVHPERFNDQDFRVRFSAAERAAVLGKLSGGGRPPQGGTKTLTDMNYLMNPSARFSGDRFVYEKAPIDDWLRQIAVR